MSAILIGLLENTGNFYARKKEALNEAQKTADISRLVGNLQTVKELKANTPVLNSSPKIPSMNDGKKAMTSNIDKEVQKINFVDC